MTMKLYDVIRKEQLEKQVGSNLYDDESVEDLETSHVPQYHDPEPRISKRKILLTVYAVLFVTLLYVIGVTFVHAKVYITERHIPFSLNKTPLELVHEKEADIARLSFQAMVVTTEVSREVYGGESRPSTTKARGKVIIFNEYNKNPISVKSGTTLTATNGKKYVTQESVVVPGFTLKGKVKEAGASTPVSIIAQDIGPTYNTEGASFTINGWSSTSVAKQFYARTAGAISGGEAGAMHTVSDAERASVIATLQAQLTERLKRETRSQIPPELVTFPELQFISIDNNSLRLEGQNIKFPAALRGTMVSYLVSRDLLEKAIADKVMSDHHYPDVAIPNLGDLTVESLSTIPTNPSDVPETIRISLSGEGTLITKAPTDVIAGALIGIARKDFTSALSSISEIDTARYKLIPFWAMTFPKERRLIDVVVQ